MSDDWTEKYRPQSLSKVIGNPSASKELKDWALSWDNGVPKKRAVVLIGTPGVGKTSSALALAKEMGWGLVEMNASDQRTGDAVRSIATRGAYSNTFNDLGDYLNAKDGGRKLIVLDEADNLFGTADRGALPAINELIKTTMQPVILIVNDFYALSRKSSAIKTDTIQITLRRPTARSIAEALKRIAESENISVDQQTVDRIAENSGGDMRAAVRDFESLALGETSVSSESADLLSERIVKKDMYALMDSIFRKNDPMGSKSVLRDTDSDPDTALLWVDENLPYEYTDPGDLVRGYERLSRADIFLGRVHRRQYYGFWSYAGEMMTAGVATARFGQMTNHGRFRFPQYLMKMSRSKSVRTLRNSICLKLAVFLHTSTKRIDFDVLPSIRELAENDAEFRGFLAHDVLLDPEELGFILNSKMDSDIVKAAFATDTKPIVKPIEKAEPVAEINATEPVVPATRNSQRSLFEF